MGPTTSASRLRGTRLALVLTILFLTVIGVLFVHSARSSGNDSFPNISSRLQIIKAIVGIVAFLFIAHLDYRVWERHAFLLYAALTGVLGAMIVVKFISGDLLRFIKLPFFQIQPSELMKIVLVLVLARYLRFRDDQRQLRGLVTPFLLTVFPMALVLLQPDLGTSLMFPPVLLGMLFIAGAKWRYLALTVVGGVLLLPAAYFAHHDLDITLVRGYQLDRITAYFDRDDRTLAAGDQPLQSEVAVSSGGLLGKGYQQGTQYIPEQHTDFIFSVIAEEKGFLGAGATLLASLLVPLLMLRVAMLTRDPFGRLVATGLALEFAAQSFQNVAMSMRLTPVTGITLPFVSFGGSSLVTSYLAVGIVYSIARVRIQVIAPHDLDPREAPRRIPLLDDRAAGTLHARWPVD